MTPHDKHILVVDDSASVRTLLRIALEKAGYAVFEACDGRDAIAKLSAARPNLIVIDMNMPNMDGLEFVRCLKQTTLHRFTPLVMLTTTVDAKKKADAREAGVSAWINKPFDSATLLGAVERLCI